MTGTILEIFPFIDYIVSGEGELSFIQLARELSNGRRGTDIAGVSFINGSRTIVRDAAPLVEDLDTLPRHLYEGLDARSYIYFNDGGPPTLRLEEGRGCPFHCTFCSTSSFWQRRLRRKSPERVIEEMMQLHDRHGVESFSLVNDCFNSDQTSVRTFCTKIERAGQGYHWGCSVRPDLLTEDILTRMQLAGCEGFFCGIESGSPRIQQIIQKKTESTADSAADT